MTSNGIPRAWVDRLVRETEVDSVVLGGRRAIDKYRGVTSDPTSDVDIYAFASDDRIPSIANRLQTSGQLGYMSVSRERPYFYEVHFEESDAEVDLKVMSWEYLDAVVGAVPSLDEIYLEKVHSLQNYQVLADSDDMARKRIDVVRARMPGDITQLQSLAIESYIKHAWGVGKQGIRRGKNEMARVLAARCFDYLVISAYLQSDIYPPPFKWRLDTAYVEDLVARTEIVHASSVIFGDATLEEQIAALRLLEPFAIPSNGVEQWWWPRDE